MQSRVQNQFSFILISYRWENLSLVTETVFTYTVRVAELWFWHGRQLPAPSKGACLLKDFFFFLQEKKKLIIKKKKKESTSVKLENS